MVASHTPEYALVAMNCKLGPLEDCSISAETLQTCWNASMVVLLCCSIAVHLPQTPVLKSCAFAMSALYSISVVLTMAKVSKVTVVLDNAKHTEGA